MQDEEHPEKGDDDADPGRSSHFVAQNAPFNDRNEEGPRVEEDDRVEELVVLNVVIEAVLRCEDKKGAEKVHLKVGEFHRSFEFAKERKHRPAKKKGEGKSPENQSGKSHALQDDLSKKAGKSKSCCREQHVEDASSERLLCRWIHI